MNAESCGLRLGPSRHASGGGGSLSDHRISYASRVAIEEATVAAAATPIGGMQWSVEIAMPAGSRGGKDR